jgi:hypothetical protein
LCANRRYELLHWENENVHFEARGQSPGCPEKDVTVAVGKEKSLLVVAPLKHVAVHTVVLGSQGAG